MIVEIGILLPKPLQYYQELLQKQNAELTFSCTTHDIYWCNIECTTLAESEIKSACVRYREVQQTGSEAQTGEIQNCKVFNTIFSNEFKCEDVSAFEEELLKYGWKRIIDTSKKDYQYRIGEMKRRIQLQIINDIGLVVYYDNPDLYHLPELIQRKLLIDELNSYGFEITYDTQGIDKLRTLLTGTRCYSLNQAG